MTQPEYCIFANAYVQEDPLDGKLVQNHLPNEITGGAATAADLSAEICPRAKDNDCRLTLRGLANSALGIYEEASTTVRPEDQVPIHCSYRYLRKKQHINT